MVNFRKKKRMSESGGMDSDNKRLGENTESGNDILNTQEEKGKMADNKDGKKKRGRPHKEEKEAETEKARHERKKMEDYFIAIGKGSNKVVHSPSSPRKVNGSHYRDESDEEGR